MTDQTTTYETEAHELGVAAAKAAASWTVDGNTKTEAIPAVLAMFDDGDPQLWDYLPPMPNLSGEWADEMTPGRLFEEVTGLDAHAEATFNQEAYQVVLEAICEAWEAGVPARYFKHRRERTMTHATTIVAYTYDADVYCEHCTAVMFEREDADAPSIFDGAERILDDEARRRGIDRYDEATFDSDDFPKVIFASQVESDDERCGECGESLIA